LHGDYITLRAHNGKYVRFVQNDKRLLADSLERSRSQKPKAWTFVDLIDKNSPQIPLDEEVGPPFPILIFRAKYCGTQYNNIKVTITKGNPSEQGFNIRISMYNQANEEIYIKDFSNCDMTNVESKISDFNPFVECVILYKTTWGNKYYN